MKKAIVILAVLLAVAIGGNVIQWRCNNRKGPSPSLGKVTTGETHTQTPCAMSPIEMRGRMIADVLEVTASTHTPECGDVYAQAWFNFTCPVINYKHTLTIAPGLYFIYDVTGKKFRWAPGGALGYARTWGRFGFGVMGQVWCTTNTDMFGGAVNAQIQYRW